VTAPNYEFRPMTADDLPLMRRWLEMPHIKQWWGEPDEELGYIRDMIDGRDTTRPFIFAVDDEPVGYIQYWFVGHHQNATWVADHPWLAELPSDAVGVDLSIGDSKKLGRGLGSAALRAFAEDLFRQGHRTIVIDPDPTNTRAVRAYEKAGFKAIPHLLGGTGDTLIMQYGPEQIDCAA
jgi:aminoglycoside 6'-N-acetyltransferase